MTNKGADAMARMRAKKRHLSQAVVNLVETFPEVDLVILRAKIFVYKRAGRSPLVTLLRNSKGEWVSGDRCFPTTKLALRWASAVVKNQPAPE